MPEGAAWLIAFREGDAAAFDRFYTHFRPTVYRFVYLLVGRHDQAEDLTQETFVRVIRAAPGYTPRAKVSTWLLQIAKNLCYDHFKKEGLRAHPSLDAPATSAEGAASMGELLEDVRTSAPHESLTGEEEQQRLLAAIESLSVDKREALALRVFHGLPYDEIAPIVGSPVGTLKYRVHVAINELRDLLGVEPPAADPNDGA